MSAREDLRRAAPWVLCGSTLVLLGLGNGLRWVLGDEMTAEHIGRVEGTIGALGLAGIPVVGALIASRLPGNPYGWVWCAAGLAYAVFDATGPLARVAGWPPWVAWLSQAWGLVGFVGLMVFVFLLFPTGRVPSDRWRWVGRAAVTVSLLLALAAPFITDATDPAAASPLAPEGPAGRYLGSVAVAGLFGMFGAVLVAMSSLVLRFRRADAVQRRQLSWFLYAALINGLVLVLDSVAGVLPPNLATAVVSAAAFGLLPLAVGIAVLRYRLFEIDRIVSRTVSYGLLTAALVAGYLVLVAVLRPLLAPLAGSSALAVAGSTLAVAAVFNPARRRLQAVVDRRFDRARYDAARAVDAFAARMRDQVDLDQVITGLRGTVGSTVVPTRVGLWLRDTPVQREAPS